MNKYEQGGNRVKIPFIFGIHCHQPVNNFHYVVDDAVERCYRPFLKTAVEEKNFKFAVHYSGWLLEYIRTRHEDVFRLLRKLAEDGRAEFFTGGFYEPILAAIPSDDRRGQINKLCDYIKNHFGQRPKGLWLTERVWDPSVVPDACECGIEHIIVDDYHLFAAGFPEASVKGYFKTEQDGYGANVFPIDRKLRYLIPFRKEEEILNYVEKAAESGTKLITCFDDGEKFGIWPGTYERVYDGGWLKRFIRAVAESPFAEFAHYGETAEKHRPCGLAYLPITSYPEMGEWSLFCDRYHKYEEVKTHLCDAGYEKDAEHFLKGSIWKNFLIKYPESNRLQKMCMDLSLRGREYKNDPDFADALYRSQCNDSLWHGVFGGIYLPNLRDEAWRAKIEAETIYEKISGTKIPSMETKDADFDGYPETYVRSKAYNALFVSRDCGQMSVMELKDGKFNLLNVVARREEGYHRKLLSTSEDSAADESVSIHERCCHIPHYVASKIAYDWYNKNCFIDHFVQEYSLQEFESCSFRELGDFVNQPADKSEKGGELIFDRDGGIYPDGRKIDTHIRKSYRFEDKSIDFHMEIRSKENYKCIYVMEHNFHFADLSRVTANDMPVGEKGVCRASECVFSDPYLNKAVKLSFDEAAELSWYVIYTVSQSESGIDMTAQGLTVTVAFEFEGALTVKGKLTVE